MVPALGTGRESRVRGCHGAPGLRGEPTAPAQQGGRDGFKSCTSWFIAFLISADQIYERLESGRLGALLPRSSDLSTAGGDLEVLGWRSWILLVLMSLPGALLGLGSAGLTYCMYLVEGNGCVYEGKLLCD